MIRRIHMTAEEGFIVYLHDRIIHECDTAWKAVGVMHFALAAEGTERCQGAGRAEGESMQAYQARRARAVAATMAELLAFERDQLRNLKRMTVDTQDLQALTRQSIMLSRERLKSRIAIKRRLP